MHHPKAERIASSFFFESASVVTTQTLRLNNSVINAVRVDTLFAEWSVACGMEFLSVCSKLQKISGVMKKQVSKVFLRPQRKSVAPHLQHQHNTFSMSPFYCVTNRQKVLCPLPNLGQTCALSAAVGLLALIPETCSQNILEVAIRSPSLESAAALASNINVSMPCPVFSILNALLDGSMMCWKATSAMGCCSGNAVPSLRGVVCVDGVFPR